MMRAHPSRPLRQSLPPPSRSPAAARTAATPTTPTATAGTSGAQVEVGNTINYGSFGTTADIDCADGKSLNIGGSNNTLTVKGTCANVNIGGADNKVTSTRSTKRSASSA